MQWHFIGEMENFRSYMQNLFRIFMSEMTEIGWFLTEKFESKVADVFPRHSVDMSMTARPDDDIRVTLLSHHTMSHTASNDFITIVSVDEEVTDNKNKFAAMTAWHLIRCVFQLLAFITVRLFTVTAARIWPAFAICLNSCSVTRSVPKEAQIYSCFFIYSFQAEDCFVFYV